MPARGKALETALEQYHRDMSASMWVIKMHPKMRTGSGRRMYPIGDGPPDFMGFTESLPVCFESKEFSEDSFPLSKLKPHQADYLDRAQTHGAVSFLVVAHVPVSPIERCWFIPWGMLRDHYRRWQRGHDAGQRAKARQGGLYLPDLERIGVELVGVAWVPALVDFVRPR